MLLGNHGNGIIRNKRLYVRALSLIYLGYLKTVG